ncbi:MAG TPA: chromate transporter, partial [Planctomycetota bacterium]|nr:chromate transporter [Planctomycetota bacterium]
MKSILWRLFMTFFKIGLFTFGGGYAMIGIIENECVEKNKWITDEEMSTILAIAESTPGPISVN